MARIEYALPDAKRNFWSARFPTAGTVFGATSVCDGCPRVVVLALWSPRKTSPDMLRES